MTHIDLFTGIGGFALAASWAGFRTVAMCEIDEFCQEVLAARFGSRIVADPKSGRRGLRVAENKRQGEDSLHSFGDEDGCGPLLIPDIRDFDGSRFRGATVLTGGFPCQPFSCAGKRRGKDDNRHLWPEMRRVIHEARPAWIHARRVQRLKALGNAIVPQVAYPILKGIADIEKG